jgi:hypothetical protein
MPPSPPHTVLFSSEQRVPPRTPDNDLVRLYTEAYGLHPTLPAVSTHELVDYLKRPTLRNARRVLRSYRIPEPLRGFLPVTRRAAPPSSTAPNAPSSSSRGASQPPPPPPPPSPQKGAAPPKKTRDALFRELLLYDTLHDLHPVPRNDPDCTPLDVLDWVAGRNNLSDMPRELRNAFLLRETYFTRLVAEHMLAQSGMSMYGYYVPMQAPERLHRQTEGALSATVQDRFVRGVPALLQDGTLNVVLDNVVAGLATESTVSEATLAGIACAFLTALLTNVFRAKRAAGDMADTPTTILLYDGLFLQLDGHNYVQRFWNLYCRTLKRCVHVRTVEVVTLKKSEAPPPRIFNRIFGTDVALEEAKTTDPEDTQGWLTLHGQRYPIVVKSQRRRRGATKRNNPITFPHTKETFYAHVKSLREQSSDLWTLNFLRDAYKTDVAFQNNWIYLTHDRLAYLYYKMLGGMRGVLLTLEKGELGTRDFVRYLIHV